MKTTDVVIVGGGVIGCAITGRSIAESVLTGKVPAIIQPFSATRFYREQESEREEE